MEGHVSRNRIVLAAYARRKAMMDVTTSAERNSAATAFCKQRRTVVSLELVYAPSEKSATCKAVPARQNQRAETMLLKRMKSATVMIPQVQTASSTRQTECAIQDCSALSLKAQMSAPAHVKATRNATIPMKSAIMKSANPAHRARNVMQEKRVRMENVCLGSEVVRTWWPIGNLLIPRFAPVYWQA